MLKIIVVVLSAAALCSVICAGDGGTRTVLAGSNLTLTCPRHSDISTLVSVTWTCRGCGGGGRSQPVEVARYNPDGTVSRARDTARLLLPTFQLQIFPVGADDAGVYVCSVNDAPSADAYTIVVEDVPPPPQRPLVVGFTSRSAELSWAPRYSENDTPSFNYVIQKRVHDPLGPWDQRHEVYTPTSHTIYNVTQLLPFTAYEFRVFSVNRVGRSQPSPPSYPMVTHREEPSGKPTVIRTVSSGPTSIEVVWRPPDADTMHGEFIGHVLSYRPREKAGVQWDVVDLPGNDNDTTSYLIENLTPFTEYLIRIRVKNMVGLGPYSIVRETTQEGVPERPERLSNLRVGDSWALLSWRRPRHPNGHIVGYYLYFEFNSNNRSITDTRIIHQAQHVNTYNLTGLVPYTRYTVWLNAKTGKHEGVSSERLSLRTDVGAPSAPELQNVSCRADTSVFLEWRRPRVVHGSIDSYHVLYRQHRDAVFQVASIPTSYSVRREQVLLANLSANTVYVVRVRGVARSRFNSSRLYLGPLTAPRQVQLQPDCERVQVLRRLQEQEESGWQLGSGVVAGVVCAALALLLAALALIVWRRYFQQTYNYIGDPNKGSSTLCTEWELDCFDSDALGPTPVHLFPKLVSRQRADDGLGFSKEYEAIQAQTLKDSLSSELSQRPENKNKNRYLNIVAYDHTMVPLPPSPDKDGKEQYVNANFIDGYQRAKAYIGTQGPLPETFDTFWSMVWEHNVHIIVMITNLVERGRKKCDQYWPQEGKESYGDVQVILQGQNIMATYTIRKFSLRHLKEDKKRRRSDQERVVYQYQFTSWPDHGIPESPLPLLSFVRKSAAANPDCAGPILVHCSAGVGRTGTYIVLDAMMRMIRAKGELNVFGFLKHIRTQRSALVQTEEQYVFVYEALLEAVQSGETDIHRSFFRRYLHHLQTTSQDVYPWYNLERQFKLIDYDKPSEKSLASARNSLNSPKNRRDDLVGTECARVRLCPRAGVECSDYINASWMPGFSRLNEFVVTQHPLSATVPAFWQMVWEHNAQTIVLLSPVDDEEYCVFWPLENSELDCGQFRVRFLGEALSGPYLLRDLTLQSKQDEYELSVRIIQSSNWPETCIPIGGAFDLVQVVLHWHLEYQNGPCLVVDRFGGTEAATFCLLTILLKQLEYESHADVYMYARQYHARRPGVWRSQEEYLRLYRAVEALVAGETDPPTPPPPDVADVQRQTLKPILKRSGSQRARPASVSVRIPPDGMESVVVDVGERRA